MIGSRHAGRAQHGFTLVELVLVIMVTGALAVFVVPRMLDLTAWRLRAFGDEMVAQTQAMQRLALTQRRVVVGTFTDTGVSFAYSGGAALLSLPCPAAASPCISSATPSTVTFNAGNSGAAVTSSGAALTISVAGGGATRHWRIEPDTGLMRAQ